MLELIDELRYSRVTCQQKLTEKKPVGQNEQFAD